MSNSTELDYECPRCGYSTEWRKNMRKHLVEKKKPCPNFKNLELTDEIKNTVLDSRRYYPPKKEPEKKNVHRKTVPQALKMPLWSKYIGNFAEGTCFCCEHATINAFNFHCGHVIAHANGGKITLDNLRPICASCNLSMGTENLFEFKSRLTESQSLSFPLH